MTQDFKVWRKQRQGIPTWKTVEEAYELGRQSRQEEVDQLERQLWDVLSRSGGSAQAATPAPAATPAMSGARGESKDRVLAVLREAGQPLRLRDIWRGAGMGAPQSAHHILNQLTKLGLVEHLEKGVYRLTPAGREAGAGPRQWRQFPKNSTPGPTQYRALELLQSTGSPMHLIEIALSLGRTQQVTERALRMLVARGRLQKLRRGVYALPNGESRPAPNPLQHGFGPALRQRREAAGLSRDRLAELSGLSRAQVARAEQGLHPPALETLQALARGLGLDPATIV